MKLYGNIFFLLSFFPYITFGLIPSDLSPLPVFLAMGYLIVDWRGKVKLVDYLLFFALCFFGGAAMFALDTLDSLKYLITCLSLAIFPIVYQRLILTIDSRYLTAVLLVYVVSVLIQILVDKNIFSFLMYRVGSTEGRGFSGITPEPAYLGYAALYLLFFSDCLLDKKTIKTYWLNVSLSVMLVAFSMSVMAVALLALYFTIRFSRYFALILVGVAVSLYIAPLNLELPDTRIINLAGLMMNDPLAILGDASAMIRFSSFFTSLYVGFELTNGFGYVPYEVLSLIQDTRLPDYLIEMYHYDREYVDGKLMGGGVAFIYYFGVIGALFWLMYILRYLKSNSCDSMSYRKIQFLSFFVFILPHTMFNSLANPLFSIMLVSLVCFKPVGDLKV